MRLIVFATVMFSTFATSALAAPEDFPRPASLQPAIAFWTRVYTEIDTSSGFLHDNENLDVVYETVRIPADASSRTRRRTVDAAREKYRDILNSLASGKRDHLSADEQRVLDLWPDDVSKKELAAAAGRLRFQLGQSDRFRAGLERSGAWKPHIEAVLKDRGLPIELAALPHVESSFDPTAYSRVGAAGLWQFTRSTGLRYMQIDHIIDERRDPFMSTYAAARLLEDNHAVAESWPIALTAYNHGLAGMRRAIAKLNTHDIGRIVAEYDGRTFGFASRNFYAAFLAALDIDRSPERYFQGLVLAAQPQYQLVKVPDFVDADTLADALGISRKELQRLNPALMETVWEGDKFVPKGFELRLPAGLSSAPNEAFASIPANARFAQQRPDQFHRVRSGDTLSQIAERYNVSLAALVRANGLRSSDFIRVGQTLTLPTTGGATPPSLAALDDRNLAGDTYIVRRGDTVDVIARRIGTSREALLAANNLANANRIYAGQALRVPSADAAGSQAAETLAVVAASTTAPALIALTSAVQPRAETLAESIEDEVSITPAVLTVTPLPVGDSEQGEALADSTPIELSADPNDYSVAADDTIEVQEPETLGHYADWLGIPTQRLRDRNDLAFRQPVIVGRRIALDFSVIDRATFEQRRMAFHQTLQEEFFSSHHIEDVTDHVVRRGESLWLLAQQRYNVPVWLLRQYNPDLDLDRIAPGVVVKFPTLRRIDGA
jgi:membrane-bound lytic murein transglycosylase D